MWSRALVGVGLGMSGWGKKGGILSLDVGQRRERKAGVSDESQVSGSVS